MVDISIKTNFPQVQRKLDALHRDIRTKVAVSALNKTMAQGSTAMSREIRGEFNLTAAKVREKLFVKRATFKAGAFAIEAALQSRSPGGRRRAINLINFAARETSKGLTVKIKRKGGRVVAKRRGFIGNKGRTAFMRVGDKRLPIRPLQTIDVPQMFNTRRINAAVRRVIVAKFPEIFDREARFYVQRFNRG